MIWRHSFPVETVGVENIKAEVCPTVDCDTLDVGSLVAEAERNALVVPFCTYFVTFASVTASAFLALLRHAGFWYFGQKSHVNCWYHTIPVNYSDEITATGLEIPDDSL